jgi:hypothetical protein
MRARTIVAGVAIAIGASATSGRGAPVLEGQGAARTRGFVYHDNSGLDVQTASVEAEQRLSARWSVQAEALVDHISIERRPYDPGDVSAGAQATGHDTGHLDAVTSASALATGGGTDQKTRTEGIAGVTWRDQIGSAPIRIGLIGRVSNEVDYSSVGGRVRAEIELFERNTTLAIFLGFGRDEITPLIPPPGQRDDWPATNRLVKAGASVSQLLSSRIALLAGAAATAQRGQLANPYRRAVVVTTLFPEVVPDERNRQTGYVGLSLSATEATGVHLALGGYRDDWGVRALVPEAAIVQQLGARGLATLRYRYYRQTAADFYEPTYLDLAPIMSGDFRMGRIRAHSLGVAAEWLLVEAAPNALVVQATYDWDLTKYPQVRSDVTAHIGSIALEFRY